MKYVTIDRVIIALVVIALMCSFYKKNPSQKIGYIRSTAILDQIAEYSGAHTEFEEKSKQWDNGLKIYQDSIKSVVKLMNAGNGQVSGEQMQAYKKQLEDLQERFRNYQIAIKKSAETEQKNLLEPIIASINKKTKSWSKDHGYTIVLGTMQGGNIVAADTTYDLTDSIIIELKEEFKPVSK